MSTQRVTVVSVVLAAGEGSRLGGPKALLAWPSGSGEVVPLAIAHAWLRLESESHRVMVVVRHEVASLLARYERDGIEMVVSTAAESLGAAGSIASALPFLGDADHVVLAPVDTPPALAPTVRRLLDALTSSSTMASRPMFEGRGGHPVVLRRGVLDRYAGPTPPPLREHLRVLGAACVSVECGDPAVRMNLNTPDDVWAARGQGPMFVR